MKDGHTKRPTFARAVMDPEFEKCINAANSKWDMVAETFKICFVAKKSLLACVDEDITLPALLDIEKVAGLTLQRKWEKITKDYRELMLLGQSVEMEVMRRKHVGAKRPQEEY
jgi:hypothetical protein